MAKISFEVVSEKYKANEKKNFRKSHFFGMTPFLGTPISQKSSNVTNRHAKIIIKMYFKHYYFLWYNTFCLWNITTKINFNQCNFTDRGSN